MPGDYLEYFAACGGTDDGYLRAHWLRFRNTMSRFDALGQGQRHARVRRRRALVRAIPPLRSRLHVEIDLPEKTHGIAIEPHW